MDLYNDILRQLRSLLPCTPSKRAEYNENDCAADGEKDRILFRADTAYELGGGGKRSASAVLFADIPETKSETLLYGPDLADISADTPFAHITVVKLREDETDLITAEQLKSVGFTVFQLYPEGYHIRVSPVSCKEQVRVAKAALAKQPPLSFINVGNRLIKEFLRRQDVATVQTVFITDPGADYKTLSALALKAKRVTDAVQSTLVMDEVNCAACKMKPVCDEIDGLRELHFEKQRKISEEQKS